MCAFMEILHFSCFKRIIQRGKRQVILVLILYYKKKQICYNCNLFLHNLQSVRYRFFSHIFMSSGEHQFDSV